MMMVNLNSNNNDNIYNLNKNACENSKDLYIGGDYASTEKTGGSRDL